MPGNDGNSAATGFGQQLRKMRQSRHWTLRELAARTGVNYSILSRVENGQRPPTEALARALDRVFTELPAGWFRDAWSSSRTWAPPGFIDWSEYEDQAAELLSWTPAVVSGLAQTAGYARGLLATYPGASAEQVGTRLKGRMARQRRLYRDEGPAVILLVDMASLYRAVGSTEVMAEQCARLAGLAGRPNVTLQVVPPVAIPLGTASLVITDTAGYTENALTGAVYTDTESVIRLRRLFDTVRAEARPASESLAITRRAEQQWKTASVSRPTAPTGGPTASR
jgi:transcriptional regulator with XRE-family HTH domain